MKTWVVSVGLVALVAVAASADEKWVTADLDEVTTSIGTFTTERVGDTTEHRLLLNGQELDKFEGQGIALSPVLKGKAQSFLLAFYSTGGSACPGMFVAWRLKTPVVFSEQFGTCNPAYRARVDGDRLIVTMPSYISHPDLLSKDDVRKRERTEVVYTYVNGVLSETEVLR